VPNYTVAPVVISLDQTDYYSLELGVGYSFVERVRALLILSYANLFHRGHRITLDGELSSIEQRGELIYSTPWLFMVPLQTELSGYYRRHDLLFFDVPLGFTGEFAGFSATVGQVTEFGLSYGVGFNYENVIRLAVPGSETLPDSIPDKNTASFDLNLSLDRRNDIFSPTRGYLARSSSEFAGVFGGATNQFVKAEGEFSGYYNIGDALFFASGVEFGWVGAYGESEIVPPQEQFFAGGPGSVRGYDFEKLIIDDRGNPVGGNVKLVVHVIDFRFPLFWWFWGAAFLDAGYVWQDLESIDLGDVKYGAGPSLRLMTPIAMVRFDVGFKLDPLDQEDLVVFYLDIGQAF
ncbi:MAG: BamA/TamA family outer membrane protein, partial [Chitinivibrionales bacterium]|nr:BamA/TamA family outer membrane protein [Chitinivibrionales bacterium]